jgi:acetyltransferase-like isoleucine patch superfamily enzyme
MVPVESEPWFWIREAVTFLPGELGLAIRVGFYNRYLKHGSDDLLILPGAQIEHPQNVEFGAKCTLGRNSYLDGIGGLSVGDSTGIGPTVFIHTANHVYDDPATPFLEQGHVLKPVIIEGDVWLAGRVTVLPGTHVATGAVIMAGAVVSGRIKAYSIIGGNPGRAIGTRGERELRAAVQRLGGHG